MKMKEELNTIKEVDTRNKKLEELNNEEIGQISGGLAPGRKYWNRSVVKSLDTVLKHSI